MRLVGIVLILWLGTAGLISWMQRDHWACEPLCWYDLHLRASNEAVQDFLISHKTGITLQNGRYEWTHQGGDYTFLMTSDKKLMRIDAAWTQPDDRPTVGQVLLLMGAPDGLQLQSEVVANVRRLNAILFYVSGNQLTLITLRRIGNDPTTFGQFRLRPNDRVLRISRYNGSPSALVNLTTARWRGFAFYHVERVCC